VNTALGIPDEFEPDETDNYEIGIKGDFFERRLTLDASAYYIDWKDIQLTVRDPATGLGYNTNASRAKSEGVEVAAILRPWTGMTLTGWVAWNDAELTKGFPPTSSAIGTAGDRLPFSSPWSGEISADQDFPLGSDVTGSLGALASFIGDRKGPFGNSALRQDLPSYTQIDLHAGIRYRAWTANLFVNNVTDERGLLSGGLGSFNPAAFNYIRPRTYGMAFSRTF
jgi:outer membrane receptor protein involved in Fe transport